MSAEALALVFAGVAAVFDHRTGRIPNWLTMCAVCAPLAHGLASASFRAGLDSVLGALACAAVPALLFRQDAIGGGDVKLLAAIGSILCVRLGLEAEMWAFLVALPFLALILRRQRQGKALIVSEFRFGPAVFVGVAIALARQFAFQGGR